MCPKGKHILIRTVAILKNSGDRELMAINLQRQLT